METLPAVAVNVVEVVPSGTITELDRGCNSVLLLDSKTSVPPAVAAPFNVTVQVVEAPEFKLFGLQFNWETEMICPKATLEINKPIIPMIKTLTPVMKSSHDGLPNEMLVPGGALRFADRQAYPRAMSEVKKESFVV